jgi:hypothetical protein
MTTIYGSADIADALGVTKSAASNWLARRNDWPTPDYQTPDGRLFWSDLRAWHTWHQLHVAA